MSGSSISHLGAGPRRVAGASAADAGRPTLATVHVSSHIQAQGAVLQVLSDGRIAIDCGPEIVVGRPIE